jgi:uncharacterized membrane protein YkvA (DUF1232 family)
MWRAFFKAVRRGEYKVSGWSWAALVGTIIYTISPVDLIPELLFPIVGYIDDLGLWGVMSLLAARERHQWQASMKDGAIDVMPRNVRD